MVEALDKAAGPPAGKTIEVHAGAAYADAIRTGLQGKGSTVVEPLAGLTIGPRLAWYGPTAQPSPARKVPSQHRPSPEISDLITELREFEASISPAAVLATGGQDLRHPGLYSWWVDEKGAADLAHGLGFEVSAGLI